MARTKPQLRTQIRTDKHSKQVYYQQVIVGEETYSCGDCVAMETDHGEFLAEVLYVFGDAHRQAWVENRWLYNKEEVQDIVPKNRCPDIDDAEVFETKEVCANPAEAILRKVVVLDERDYRQRVDKGDLDDNRVFFCNKYFETDLKRFFEAGGQGPALRLKRGRKFSKQRSWPENANSDDDDDDDDDMDDGDRDTVVAMEGKRDARGGASRERPSEHHRSKRRREANTGERGHKGSDKFRAALDSLHVTAVPKTLPCRSKERDTLLRFLRSNVKSGGMGNALFVAGMPGTGKTATAHEVLGILREQQERGELPDFKLVELNGMRLVKPHQAYTQLWMMLSGEMAFPKKALSKLDRYFSDSDPSREFVVLLVDELDYMTTTKQTVLYNLFEWPSRPHARLVVVGIANTMDLPERCMPRVSSRLTARLMFPAYSKEQLVEIVRGRLSEANAGERKAFKPDAINMASAKVAASSGDMRTCLKYCFRAIEVCKARLEAARAEGKGGEEEGCEVSVDDVRRAVTEINQQAHLLAVRDAAPQEKLLLLAICNEIYQSGRELVEMDAVRERMEGICRAHPNGPRMPNVATILEMLSRLGDGQVLTHDFTRRAPLPDVQLNMTVNDVAQMLRDDEAFARKVLPESLTSQYPPTSSSS